MSIAGTYADEATKFGGHLIATNSAASSAFLVFSNAVFGIPAYNTYIFEISNLFPVTGGGGSHFAMQVSADGGANYATNYWWQVSETYSHQPTPAYFGAAAAGGTVGVWIQGAQAANAFCGRVTIYANQTGLPKEFTWHTSGQHVSNGNTNAYGSGICPSLGYINAVRFYFLGDTIGGGVIRMYGLTK